MKRVHTKAGKKVPKNALTWLAIPGCFFLGMAGGFILGNVPAGIFMGLGVGFLLVLILNKFGSKK